MLWYLSLTFDSFVFCITFLTVIVAIFKNNDWPHYLITSYKGEKYYAEATTLTQKHKSQMILCFFIRFRILLSIELLREQPDIAGHQSCSQTWKTCMYVFTVPTQ